MTDEPDLVGLLYRAEWTRLSLAADVSTSGDSGARWGSSVGGVPPLPSSVWWPWLGLAGQGWAGPWPSAPDWPRDEEPDESREEGREWEVATDEAAAEPSRYTLVIAPGGRYRWEGEDLVTGCDGERSWHAVRDDDGWTVMAVGGPEPPPLASMLRPSWLLAGFALEAGGPMTAGGRDAVRAVATPRPGPWGRPWAGHRADLVEVIVDAGLGLLLRCEEIPDGRPPRVTELTGIRVDLPPPDDDAWCRPPGGWDAVGDDVPRLGVWRTGPDGAGWEVVKLTAGLAAGGLGALLKSSKFRPFERATQEEAEAQMPPFEGPLPADGPPPGGEVLRLMHDSRDRWAPGIAATLHEWHDVAAMLSRVPDGARRAGFGGLGFLIEVAGERIDTLHTVSRLRLSGSGQYRIEPVTAGGAAGGGQDYTVVCDGERRWRIFADKVIEGPASPPLEIPNLFDASWLLGRRLAGGAEIVTGGRRGYRLRDASASPSGERPGGGWLMLPDEVVVDAEFGILLRWVSLAGGRPMLRYELRDVAVESFQMRGPNQPGTARSSSPISAIALATSAFAASASSTSAGECWGA